MGYWAVCSAAGDDETLRTMSAPDLEPTVTGAGDTGAGDTENSDTGAREAVGTLGAISLDCPDPAALADFYARLLGMRQVVALPDGSVVAISDDRIAVAFMRIEDYVPSSWPEPGQLQQMHLDVSVTDLPAAVERAVGLGAREADHQAGPELWRVLIDPAGHPFCLTTVGA